MKKQAKQVKKNKAKGTTPMDAALRYLTAKARTVRETELYLDTQEYGEYEVYQTVERLKELGYLNDETYAADFVRTRLATRPLSRAKLREQLYAHRLAPEAIDLALAQISDEQEAANAAAVMQKYMRTLGDLPPDVLHKRLLQRLCSRGFSYDVVRGCMASLTEEWDEDAYSAACARGETDAEDET